MDYLARNAHKRIAPAQVLADAKTIITLAASYTPPESSVPPRKGATGEIARYARYGDYHKVLGRRSRS
jgi:epoxyqueuosine reductase QueG